MDLRPLPGARRAFRTGRWYQVGYQSLCKRWRHLRRSVADHGHRDADDHGASGRASHGWAAEGGACGRVARLAGPALLHVDAHCEIAYK